LGAALRVEGMPGIDPNVVTACFSGDKDEPDRRRVVYAETIPL
jgi:hypothetical protein